MRRHPRVARLGGAGICRVRFWRVVYGVSLEGHPLARANLRVVPGFVGDLAGRLVVADCERRDGHAGLRTVDVEPATHEGGRRVAAGLELVRLELLGDDHAAGCEALGQHLDHELAVARRDVLVVDPGRGPIQAVLRGVVRALVASGGRSQGPVEKAVVAHRQTELFRVFFEDIQRLLLLLQHQLDVLLSTRDLPLGDIVIAVEGYHSNHQDCHTQQPRGAIIFHLYVSMHGNERWEALGEGKSS